MRSTGPLRLQGHLNSGPVGVPQGGHLGVVAEGQRGDLLGVAEPVLLGARVQVLHHHQAATCVGEEACGPDRARQVGTARRASPWAQLQGLTPVPPTPMEKGWGQEAQRRSRTGPPQPLGHGRTGVRPPDEVGTPIPVIAHDGLQAQLLVAGRGQGEALRGSGQDAGAHLRLCPQARPGWSLQVWLRAEAAEGRSMGEKGGQAGAPGEGLGGREEPREGRGVGRQEGAGTVGWRTGHSQSHWHGLGARWRVTSSLRPRELPQGHTRSHC